MVSGTMSRDPAIGLCSDCQHCRIVKSQRSAFYMCRLSFTNPEFRKYPPLPVLRCSGYVASKDVEASAPSDVEGLAPSDVEGSDKLTE
jgi:hypothetical protein